MERLFLDRGEDWTFETGEVFAVELGFYLSAVDGFRRCNTVVTTENGVKPFTHYPRGLEELLIRI